MTPRRGVCIGLGAALAALVLAVACGEPEHPPRIGPIDAPEPTEPGDAGGIVLDGRPSDGLPTCGGERIRAVVDPPKVYFVLDRSGSMSEEIDGTGVTKYRAAWRAVGTLLRAIGHRIAYGAALFPADDSGECGRAREIFPATLGDPPGSAPRDQNGPILQDLMDRFTHYRPSGTTPTRAALLELRATIEALGERTHVVLATDGAPNCNEDITCDSTSCIPDIEAVPFAGGTCGDGLSCCDEAVVGPAAGANCIDAAGTVAVIRELSEGGIPTYVVGMPGSEAYAAVLAAMAAAGGTARPGATPYFAIEDQAELTAALFEIGTGIAIDCDLSLESVPPHRDLVNVYFDGQVVPLDEDNGWGWTDDAALSLRGDACATLSSGAVLEVQVVYGCRTIVR